MDQDDVEFNIEAEDLAELPPAEPAPEPADLLVIDQGDLNVAPPPAKSALTQPLPPAHAFAPVPEGPAPKAFAYKAKPTGGSQMSRGMASLALVGALGGFLAWAANEPGMNDAAASARGLTHTVIFGGLLGGLIGAALGGAEGFSTRVAEKFLRGLVLGLVIGFVGGAGGGVCGQLLYGGLGGGTDGSNFLRQMFIRALGWGLIGVGVGVAQGAGALSPRKLINGIIGGALGGFVGGLFFDPIGVVAQLLTPPAVGSLAPHGGWFSRMLAMVVLGGCTGAAIGLVEELRKEAWLIVVQGGLAGKQFILYRPTTTIGSSPKADICLLKDAGIRPQHCVLQETPGGHVLLASPEAPVLVDNRPAHHRRLVDGATITLGQTVLEYHVRVARVWAGAEAPLPGG